MDRAVENAATFITRVGAEIARLREKRAEIDREIEFLVQSVTDFLKPVDDSTASASDPAPPTPRSTPAPIAAALAHSGLAVMADDEDDDEAPEALATLPQVDAATAATLRERVLRFLGTLPPTAAVTKWEVAKGTGLEVSQALGRLIDLRRRDNLVERVGRKQWRLNSAGRREAERVARPAA